VIQKFPMYVAGCEHQPANGEWIDSFYPYSGKPWAQIPRGTAADVDAAVTAADKAFRDPAWSNLTASQRGALLRKVGDLILENAQRLAELEVKDNGKLIAEMLAQMRYLPEYFYYYGGLADKIEGATIPSDKPGMFVFTKYEPLGVIAAITPWNSPLLLTVWKLAPALAAGNTVVIKPSEHASVSMIEFAKLFDQAGFPPGVVNVVTGYGAEAGEPLVTHPKVARIAFTGGEPGGIAVYTAAAKSLKHVSLELGGKSPNIVCEDANQEQAVKGVVSGIFAATGQTCMAGSRLLVQESIHDEFVEKLVAFAGTARLGDPMDFKTQVGPVATQPQCEKVMSYIKIAQDEGAKVALGGARGKSPECGQGWFVEPTILTGVRNDMRVAREEIFGPVLSVISFRDDEEALHIANDTPYGLAAGVWTQNMRRALVFSDRLEAGTVWVNAYRVVSYTAPFGGFKKSGIGRENGQEMIKEYLQVKSVYMNMADEVPNPFVMG